MKNLGFKFSALLIPFYAMFATGPAFFAVVLEQKGVLPQHIGIYTSIIAIASAITQPLYGYLCDKTGKARTILNVACVVSVLTYFWLNFLEGTAALVLCSLLIGASINAMYGFSESWLSKLDCAKHGVNFGAVRSLGSLSYAITAAVYGFVYDVFGIMSISVTMLICVLILIPVSMCCPNPEVSAKKEKKDEMTLKQTLGILSKNKLFVLTAVCYTIAMLPTGAAITYYPIHITQLGGNAGNIGIALLVLAGSEFIAMPFFKKLESRFGTQKILAFAFTMFGVKNLALGLAPTVPLAILAAATQGLCFALAIPGVQSYVDQITDRKYSATAQLVCNTGGMMLAQIPGAILAAWLTNYTTAGGAMAILSVFAFVSGGIFIIGIKRYAKKA